MRPDRANDPRLGSTSDAQDRQRPTVRDVGAPAVIVLISFSGVFKLMLRPDTLPDDIDPTLAAAAILLAGLGGHLVGGFNQARIPPTILLGVTLALGWLHASTSPYAETKRIGLLLTALIVVGTAFLIRSPLRLRIWVWLHVVLGGLLVTTAETNEVGRLGENTIAAARDSGVVAVVLVTLLISGGLKRRLTKVAAAAITGVMVVTLVATGSRGPVLAAAVAILLTAVLSGGAGRCRRLVLASIATWLGWLFLKSAEGAGAERIRGTLEGRIPGTVTRAPRWEAAIDGILQHPDGIGWGNFWELSSPSQSRQYPHNVLLETFVEAGWVAGIVVTAFVSLAIVRLARSSSRDPYNAALLAIVIFFVLNAMVSGDMNDNRPMWVAVTLAHVFSSRNPSRGKSVHVDDEIPTGAVPAVPANQSRRGSDPPG